MLALKTPDDIALELAERFRKLRLQQGWSRREFAERAGETVSSIKRFELTGQIALMRLLNLASLLDALDTFDQVLQLPAPMTLAEVKRRNKTRLRGRTKSKNLSGKNPQHH